MYGLPEVLSDLIIQYVDLMALAYDGFGGQEPFAVVHKKASGSGVHVRNARAHRMLRDLEYRIRLLTRETDREMGRLR